VLAAADSMFLRVTVVDSDNPCAQAIELTGGIGGPAAQFLVWADGPGFFNDYGMLLPVSGQVLLNSTGVVSSAIGAFDFTFPSGTMSQWPRRCRWCVQLNYDTTGAEVLMAGILHVRMLGAAFLFNAPALETDDYIPIHTDTTAEQVLA
jgi:hypothetical protein